MTTWRHNTLSGAYMAFAIGAVGLTTAALFWLALSSGRAAVGVRMDRLCEHRTRLLMERSDALVQYAQATDRRLLESRARQLGLGPVVDQTRPVVAHDTTGEQWAGSPLGRSLAARVRPGASPNSDAAPSGTSVRPELANTAALMPTGDG